MHVKSRADIEQLMNEWVVSIEDGTHAAKGW